MQDGIENSPEPLVDHVIVPVGGRIELLARPLARPWTSAVQVTAEPTDTEAVWHHAVSSLTTTNANDAVTVLPLLSVTATVTE